MELSERLKNLSPAKRELLLKALREDATAQAVDEKTIPRRSLEGPPPLSFAQQRLWFLDQLQPGSGFYNMPIAVRLTGWLDAPALERSVNEIIRRHEALRTTFRMTSAGAIQIITPNLLIKLPVVDLSACDDSEKRTRLQKFIDDEAARGFDLIEGPLVRGRILRLAVNDHVVLFTMHHIVGDGWSLGVFLREITSLYAAFAAGQASPLRELPIQYADFACWQREWLQGDRLDSQVAYWRHQLADLDPLELPVDRPRPAIPTDRGVVLTTTFTRELTSALNDLSRRNGCTMFMTLLAAFQTLLYRYTGQDDFSVGTPTASRIRPELESLIGFFANTLVLRADLAGDPTFVELLGRVRPVVLGAFAHQDIPFEMVVDALQPERTLGRNPLFQVAFALQNSPLPPVELPGLKQARLEAEAMTTRFDLTLALTEDHSGLAASWEYSTELFDGETIAGMDQSFKALLSSIAAQPETRISRFPLASPGVQRSLARNQNAVFDEIAATLLQEAAIVDCVVRSRSAGDESWLVAYVVAPGGVAKEQLQSRLLDTVPTGFQDRVAIVPVSAIPLRASGRIDEVALERVEVIDEGLIARWEDQLSAVAGIDEVAVLEREVSTPLLPLHISDILPQQKSGTHADTDNATSVQAQHEPRVHDPHATPAISHGGPVYLDSDTPLTLQGQLRRAAERSDGRNVICIQPDGIEVAFSYRELLERAGHVMRGLREAGICPGDRVLFQFGRNQDFLAAFWGCVLGGFVPVPAALPSSYEQSNGGLSRLHASWEMLDRPLVLCGAAQAGSIRAWEQTNRLNMRVVALDDLRNVDGDTKCHESFPEDVALILLTSGSTGLPKGVQLTHRNLIMRSASSRQLNGFSADEVTLNWLPLDHVGGIVYFHLRDVSLGCRQIHAPTETFLEDPLKWLDWIDRYRATVTWAPNFAFGLVNDRAAEVDRRRWDLSSMRFISNGGEAVVARTARRFLRLLAPHGLAQDVMHPAWGMSETSSGVTYSYTFSLDSTSDDDSYVEVGGPIPGVSLRIVDENSTPVRMGEIGRLQISGDTITPGYYGKPELNHEAFTTDGWFITGDLGFLRDARMTITGREKDVIIVGGKNYSSQEIETVVEEIEGVDESFTAACAVRRLGSTDQLAIFFSATSARATELIDKIREQVVRNAGIKPDFIIPLPQKDIPKTGIGKIQYSQLRERFQSGEYDSLLKQIDIETANAHTVPDWFFERVWHRHESPVRLNDEMAEPTLVFVDGLGLGSSLPANSIRIEAGNEFQRIDSDRYRIDPREKDHYTRLLQSLADDAFEIHRIIHLWTYDKNAGASPDRGVYSLLFLIQALAHWRTDDQTGAIRLLVVSNHTQAISDADRVVPERAPILGLIRTVPQELPWLECSHLDLDAAPLADNAVRIRRELRVIAGDREVAYRRGRRMVPRLDKVDLRRSDDKSPSGPVFVTGGMYAITGGLGGIGVEIARHLLREYRARVLLLGRTPLPERGSWPSHLAKGDNLAHRLESLIALERLSADVSYEAVDVGDPRSLRNAVENWKAMWDCPLQGVIHLAGVFQERLILDETRETFAEALHPRIAGTLALHNLVKDDPDCVLISFASVNGMFGGATAGAYAAANSFLDSFARTNKANPLHYCFHWSTWDGIGMSREYRQKELARARGYESITAQQGIHSLLAGLYHGRTNLIVGLDASNKFIRRHIRNGAIPGIELAACFTVSDANASLSGLDNIQLVDRFQTRSRCAFHRIEAMPRTEAGDIDHVQLRALIGSRKAMTERVLPRNEIERRIAQIWEEVLRVPNIGVHDNFFELGGDSILAIQAISRSNQIGLQFVPAQLFQHQTVAGLASVCELSNSVAAEQGLVRGNMPLTPIQQWFFEEDLPEKHHFNMSLMLRVTGDPDLALLAAAVERMLLHHDALRLRYELTATGWQQLHAEPQDIAIVESFFHVNLSHVTEEDQSAEVEKIAALCQASLDLSKGPLMRVVYISLGAGRPGRLLVIVHHLVMDGISWRVLLQDLFTAYDQLSRGLAVTLPPKTTSFRAWSEALLEYARSEQSRRSLEYWKGLRDHSLSPIPVDHPAGANTIAQLASVSVSFTEEETQTVLQEVPKLYHTQINDVLLTALAIAFAQWTGERVLFIDLEGHGREDVVAGVDVSRTVGWFTSLFPMRFELGPVAQPGEELKAVKEQLRRLPDRGISFGILKYLADDAAIRTALDAVPQPQISFNYLGQVSQDAPENALLGLDAAPESFGVAFSPAGNRRHLIDVTGIIVGGKLHIDFSYSNSVHDKATIEHLARTYADALLGIIAHCQSPDAGGYTPSDFPLASLDDAALSQVLTQVEFDSD